MVMNLFERLAQGRPAPTTTSKQPPDEIESAQLLLNWLQTWKKPTVALRDIRVRAPRRIRNQETAIKAAQVLVQHGWLIPALAHRHDRHVWEIVHKPIVRPSVTADQPSRAQI